MERDKILQSALNIVNGNRYGTVENNFDTIAKLWNSYLGYRMNSCIKGKDVAVMMILLKLARIASGHNKTDNWIDIVGYAACGGEIESLEESTNA